MYKVSRKFKDKSSKIIYICNKQLRDTHKKIDVKYDIKNSNHEGRRIKMQDC